VVTDPKAPYFGSVPGERSLMPGDDARIGQVTFQAWQQQQAAAPSVAAQPVAAR
jgi:hypothetical protein